MGRCIAPRNVETEAICTRIVCQALDFVSRLFGNKQTAVARYRSRVARDVWLL